jgi:hypothetical protein
LQADEQLADVIDQGDVEQIVEEPDDLTEPMDDDEAYDDELQFEGTFFTKCVVTLISDDLLEATSRLKTLLATRLLVMFQEKDKWSNLKMTLCNALHSIRVAEFLSI